MQECDGSPPANQRANKALHWMAIPLRSIATSELGRWHGRFAPGQPAAAAEGRSSEQARSFVRR